MNYLELRLRNLFRHKYSVIAKHTDAVANPQYLGEFFEFYTLLAKICM